MRTAKWIYWTIFIIGKNARICSQDAEQFLKEVEQFEAALAENPSDARNIFSLAQSYKEAGLWKEALELYEQCASIYGEKNEGFFSLYLAAIAKEALDFSGSEIITTYCAAHAMQPLRAEPLYHLAVHYRQRKNPLMGYLVARFALSLPALSEAMAREIGVYEYALLLEYALCAYLIGAQEAAASAAQQLVDKSDLPKEVRSCAEEILFKVMANSLNLSE